MDGKIPKTIGVRAKEVANVVTDETFVRRGITEVPISHEMIPRIFRADWEWKRRNSK